VEKSERDLSIIWGNQGSPQNFSAFKISVVTPLSGRQSDDPSPDVFTSPLDPTSPATPRVGEFSVNDRFKDIRKVGESGMGSVYEAYDRKLSLPVALKVLRSSLFEDAASVLRLRRESEKLATLNHPNVASFHGVEEVNGNQVLVMELVEGSTLDAHIAGGPVATAEALSLMKQVAEGLHYLHQNHVIHRDLRPSNIFVLPGGKVKLADFGIAHLVPDPERCAQRGTSVYLAPELLRDHPCDSRSDIWSFAVIAYELFAGQLPWRAEVHSRVSTSKRSYEPDWSALCQLPASIRALLRQCLQPDRRLRLASLSYVRKQIEDASVTQRATATPVIWKNIIAQERRWFLLHGARPPRRIPLWPLLGYTGVILGKSFI